ncbi:CYTH and CHAD domain-containing protein [Dactylosporangium sp. AC04546]|uniref:CYTH and CHAD domain-containing protein n=1 Tax=Dactylosporangium sp. AC04546 TaxID=2862460 RepID=UPI001EE11118|nr:CYTH and CHAD domain-containing protein [Dactylosporangium sp. AC04546]WVK86215.1 CYTH and CHAD domain-containing protein [Dactylosporangium sp. AC04546]
MAGKLEVERKYEVPADFALPPLAGIGGVASVGDADDLRLDATYYDTATLRLARGRVTLRRRTGGHDAGWHLKRPSGGDRSELQVPASSSRQTKPPAAVTAQVRALSRGEALQPVARIRTHRIERALRAADGSTVALVAEDSVNTESLHGSRPERQWRELEIELVDGSRSALDDLDAALRAAGARPAASPSKLAQALGDDYPAAPPSPAKPSPLAVYLRDQRDAIVEHDPGARDGEVESVHKMRVATRRLRSTIRSFAPLLPAGTDLDELHDEIKWLTGILGEVRDGDVMGERLTAEVAAEPPELVLGPVAARIQQFMAGRGAAAREQLIAGLDSPRYTSLLVQLDAFVDAAAGQRVTRKQLMRRAHRALRRADRRLAAAGHTPQDPPALPGHETRDERLHEARKAYKRARYAAELVAPIAGAKATKLADRLTDLQDVLGAHQDSIVTGELLRQLAVQAYAAGENAFTFGLLHARQHEHGLLVLNDLPRVRRRAAKAARKLY